MNINHTIYLSSTYFGFWDFRNKNWKTRFRNCMIDNFSNFKDINFSYTFIDPLQILTDDVKIVDKDLHDINSSDYVVSYLPKKLTIGTIMEILYTSIKDKDKLILIDPNFQNRKHPWIKYWCSEIVDNEEQAASILFYKITKNFV